MIDLDYEKKEFIKIYGEIYIGEDSTWMGWQRRARLAKAEQEKLEAEFNAQLAQVEQGIDAMAQGFLAEIESLKAQLAQVKSTNHSLEEINADLSESLKLLKDKYGNDDYVLVPKEPTDEICEAIARTANVCGGIANDIYEAMIEVQEQSGE